MTLRFWWLLFLLVTCIVHWVCTIFSENIYYGIFQLIYIDKEELQKIFAIFFNKSKIQ